MKESALPNPKICPEVGEKGLVPATFQNKIDLREENISELRIPASQEPYTGLDPV